MAESAGAPSDADLARMRSQWKGDELLEKTTDEELRRLVVVNRHLHRAQARDDLIAYAQYVMPWYRPAALHREMASALMAVERGEIDRLMITVPPRHGKTRISSILYPAWRMGRTPRMEIISASYGAELAVGANGRHLRNLMQSPEHRDVFGEQGSIDPTAAAIDLWYSKAGGVFRAAGVGGGITGFGACIAEGTPVSTPDGEIPIENVRVGMRVLTRSRGKIVASRVLATAWHHADDLVRVRTVAGRSFVATADHFVAVAGVGWRRAGDLAPGDALETDRGFGALHAMPQAVPTEPVRGGEATGAGGDDAVLQRSVPGAVAEEAMRGVRRSLSGWADAGSDLLLPQVPAVDASRHPPQIGRDAVAVVERLRFVTKQVHDLQVEGSSCFFAGQVLVHNSLLIIDDPVKGWRAAESPREQKTAYDWYLGDAYTRLMPDEQGRAQGAIILIGTRWHEGDLIGRLLTDEENGEGDEWVKIYFPALPNPPWPERYGREFMERMKRVQTPRHWNALYMGNPTPEEGAYFKRDWMQRYDKVPEIARMRIYGASDYAVRHGEGDYTVHVVVGVDQHDRIYVLDFWRKQAGSDEWVETLLDMAQRWKPIVWAEESGQIAKSVGPYIVRRMRERRVHFARQQFPTMADKAIRARAIQARMATKYVYWPGGNIEWWPDVVNEFMKFPLGTNDDVVDAMSLIGSMLDSMATGRGVSATLPDGILSIGADGGTVPKDMRPILMGELSGRFSKVADDEVSETENAIRLESLARMERRYRRRRRGH